MHPALGVGELDPVAHGERAAAVGGAGRAGGRRARSASLGAGQGPLDVGGRRASRRRRRWPRPRGTRWPAGRVMASTSCSPVRSACSVRSLLQAAAQVPDRHPRPALDRHLAHRALGHQPDRRARRRRRRPARRHPPAAARRSASASGTSTATGTARRVSDRADTAGSRCWTLPCRIAWLAPTQMNAPSRAAQMTSTSETSPVAQRGDQERQAEQDDGDAAADPAGDHRAGVAAAGGPPDRGRHHPAAVQRQAGQQVEDADQQVAQHQGPGEQAAHRAGVEQLADPEGDRRQQQRDQRPGHGDPGLAARGLGRPLDLRDAAEQVQADPAHRQARAAARRRCGSARAPGPRGRAAARRSATRRTARCPSPGTSRSTVAANPQVIRPATRNQAGVTSTGTPNGRAITSRPAPGRRGPAGSSSTR